MEPVTALFGVMAALPQCIQSAKDLYDLRSRYKDASVLITAIYSESMVIAASLSQVQNLLQHDALQSKPQLLETFDRALTGCRVVYGCLEEEVRDLVAKAEADELKFKDRAKFLWKEDTFKELLTQIRGQQSALSLLIQGLQMESIADIRKLVEENKVTLETVVKRSRTLRQSHPRLHVPDSLFNYGNRSEDAADAESIAKSAEFTFDDEVVNSRAYRRAMALYTSNADIKESHIPEKNVSQDEPPAYEPPTQVANDEKRPPSDTQGASMEGKSTTTLSPECAEEIHDEPIDDAFGDDLREAFDSIEKSYLPYMPRITSTAPYLTALHANDSNESTTKSNAPHAQTPLRSYSEGSLRVATEDAPPLPPRRPSGPPLRSEVSTSGASQARYQSSDDGTETSGAPSIFSKVSTASSYTIYESSEPSHVVTRKPMRKPLPVTHQTTDGVLVRSFTTPSSSDAPAPDLPLRNAEMHGIWLSLVTAERNFVERMSKFRKMFYDNVLQSWPLLEQHLEAIIIGEQLAAMNNEMLLLVIESQILHAEHAVCRPSVFENYTYKANKIYREYCQRMPHAVSSLRTTTTMDSKFGPFVNTLGLSIAWFGKGWEDYLKLPLAQLELYADKLQALTDIADSLYDPAFLREAERLRHAAEAVHWLKTLSSTILEEASNREDVQNLEKRIHTLDSDIFSQLRLLDSDRRIRYQGSMAIKLKSHGPWQPVHVVLLDNFLLWGKVKPRKKGKGDKIIVLDAPIAVDDLKVITACEQQQFQKATMFDDIPRGSVVYVITVTSKAPDSKPHLLGAFGFQEQKNWLEHFPTASTVREQPT